MPRSAKSCVFPKVRYVPGSFTRTDNCKIIWTNSARTLFPSHPIDFKQRCMNQFNENDIGKLLRLKRHEQPPPGYFDNFLHEFHRRQRDELLATAALAHLPPAGAGFHVPSERPGAYLLSGGGHRAVLVCAAVISLKVYQTPEGP